MRESKDTPLMMPFGIWSPSRLVGHPWSTILPWYFLAALATSFEPDPSGLGLSFHWAYILQTQLVGVVVRLALPLALLAFAPAVSVATLLRLSLAACAVWLWTTPIAWLWHTPAGGILLAIFREAAWISVILAGASLRRPANPWARRTAFPALVLVSISMSIALQTLPDLLGSGGLRMDNISSGRIAQGTPDLPPGLVTRARWTLHGSDNVLQPARLSLGERQIVASSGNGRLEVDLAPGTVPAPTDTAGSGTSDPSEGASLDRLLLGIPAGTPDSLKLLMLHRAVHEAIRYTRKYFPGNSEEILQRGTGDCKAYAHLMTEGARRLGFRAKEVRGLLAAPDGYYAHAWTTIEIDGRWTDWDATSSFPFPDARYLRFTVPERASGAFDGELGIFTLERIEFKALESHP